MAKQSINVGAAANDRQGDSLRSAFQKVNANFTELYNALGLDEAPLNLGAFEFSDSVGGVATISTTDSSAVVIDQSTTVTSDLTVGGDILPSIASGGNLGSPERPWRSLYVSDDTIFIGNVALSVDTVGNLLVDGNLIADVGTAAWANITGKPEFAVVATSGSYADLSDTPTIPTDVGELTDVGNTLFDGDYSSLSNVPTIPTAVSELTNDAGYITLAEVTGGITVNPTGDLQGSVFADDSTLLVDGVNGKIVGPVDTATITASALNLNISARNYVYVDSNEGGSIVIGQGASTGPVVVGKADGIFTVNSDAYFNGDINVSTTGSIKTSDTDKGVVFEGPLTANMVPADPETPSSFNTVSNGVNIRTYRIGDDLERDWTFSWDGSLYPPYDANSGQVGAIEWRTPSFYGQLRSTPGYDNQFGSEPAGLKLLTYNGDGAIIIQPGNNTAKWIFDTDGSLQIPGDIKSENAINIDINLSDSTLRRWRFGEDGDLTLPNGQQIDATDADLLLIGTPNAGLKLNSFNQSALLTAKKSFQRDFFDDAAFTAVPGDPPKIIVTFTANQGAYLRELLRRLEIKLFNENDDFPYAYNNVTIALRPDNENITANVILVEQSNSDPLEYEITIDQDPTSVVGNLDYIQIRYDYENTIGLDVDRDIFGMATDNDDIDIISGRDIDLRAGDDISILANSTFNMTLVKNDFQNDDNGIRITTDDPNTNPYTWKFQFDGNLSVPGAIISNGSDLELSSSTDVNINTSVGTPLETALTISALGRIYLPSSTDYSLPVRSILTANDSLQINAGAVSYYLGSNGTVSLPGDALYYEPGIDFSIKTATTAADPTPQTWFIQNEGTSNTPVFNISQATVGEGNVFLTWVDPTRPGTVQVKGPGILDGDTFVNVLTLDPYGDPYVATIGGENGVFTNGEFYTFQFTEQQVDSVRQWTFDTDGQLRLPSGVGNIMFADNTVQETAAPYSVLAAAGYSVDIEDNVDLTGDGGNGADAFQTVVNFGPDEQNIELFNITTVGIGTIGGSTGGSSVYTVVLSQGTSSVTLQGWAITPTDFATQQDPEGATFHYLGELIDITGDQYQFSQVILDTSFPAGTVLRLFNPNGTLYDVPEAGMTIRWADDTETAVIGVLIDGQYIYSSNPRVTFITAEDQSTLPFPITIRTNDFQDPSKTFTIDQDIGFSLVSIDNIANIESDTGLNVRVGLGSVIEFNVDDGAQDNVVRINEDGTVYVSNGIVTDGDVAIGGIFRPQGAVIPSPVTVMPGSTVRVNDMQLEVTAIDGEGRVTAMTVLNSPNIEWASAGGTGALLGGDINISIPVDGSGNAVVTVNSSGTGHTVGEAYTIPAEQLGAVSGQVFAPIPLNSSQVQILSAEFGATGLYSLADGEEGQIMYFVPGTSVTSTVYVLIDNARIYDGSNPVNEVGYYWVPFHGETEAPRTIAMAIFADGAWCLRGGVTD